MSGYTSASMLPSNMLIGCKAIFTINETENKVIIVSSECTHSASYLWGLNAEGKIFIIKVEAAKIDMKDFKNIYSQIRQNFKNHRLERFELLDL